MGWVRPWGFDDGVSYWSWGEQGLWGAGVFLRVLAADRRGRLGSKNAWKWGRRDKGSRWSLCCGGCQPHEMNVAKEDLTKVQELNHKGWGAQFQCLRIPFRTVVAWGHGKIEKEPLHPATREIHVDSRASVEVFIGLARRESVANHLTKHSHRPLA